MEVINGNSNPTQESKRVLAGVLGIVLGALGVHKFVLGYTTQGIVLLLVSILSFGILAGICGIIGLIEGIIYLTKTDQEFVETYQVNQKFWF
jgi:TM2 domain-containing membrane protein YozV